MAGAPKRLDGNGHNTGMAIWIQADSRAQLCRVTSAAARLRRTFDNPPIGKLITTVADPSKYAAAIQIIECVAHRLRVGYGAVPGKRFLHISSGHYCARRFLEEPKNIVKNLAAAARPSLLRFLRNQEILQQGEDGRSVNFRNRFDRAAQYRGLGGHSGRP